MVRLHQSPALSDWRCRGNCSRVSVLATGEVPVPTSMWLTALPPPVMRVAIQCWPVLTTWLRCWLITVPSGPYSLTVTVVLIMDGIKSPSPGSGQWPGGAHQSQSAGQIFRSGLGHQVQFILKSHIY